MTTNLAGWSGVFRDRDAASPACAEFPGAASAVHHGGSRRFGWRRRAARLWLRRHPVPVKARFRHALVLTYAFPAELLLPLLPPGLELDRRGPFGFAAVALVQTERLRPAFLPEAAGRDFFLAGRRIFVRYRARSGRLLRGLLILRSDTDSRLMAVAGNLLTHYNYRVAKVDLRKGDGTLDIRVATPGAEADLRVVTRLDGRPESPPAGSPFSNWREARLYAGPLPMTFDYEPETHSMVMIEGVRENWMPRPVKVDVLVNTFFGRYPFNQAPAILANAFYVENIEYEWRRGVLEPLPRH